VYIFQVGVNKLLYGRVATNPDFCGTSQFSANLSCIYSRHDPRGTTYVPIFQSKKLIIHLIDSGIIERWQKLLKCLYENVFAQLSLSMYCTAAVQLVACLICLQLILFT